MVGTVLEEIRSAGEDKKEEDVGEKEAKNGEVEREKEEGTRR